MRLGQRTFQTEGLGLPKVISWLLVGLNRMTLHGTYDLILLKAN